MGDRVAHLRAAVMRLAEGGRVTGLSGVYETDPVGFLDQRPFLNMVVRLTTRLPPEDLLAAARLIETGRGRERTFRNAPRTLDIDVLLYDDRVVRLPGLEIPHPRMGERPFVLVPLLELEPNARDPVTGERYADRLAAAAGGGTQGVAGVVRVMDGAELLAQEEGEGDG